MIPAITLKLCVHNYDDDETGAAKKKMKRTAQEENKYGYQ